MKYSLTICFVITSLLCMQAQTHVDTLIDILHNPQQKQVLLSSHRCDWRNHSENSIPALKASIETGVDIAELDLEMTKDSVLVILHDKTIDRTTTGKGKPQDYTLEEIQKFKLKNGLGRALDYTIPTFKEYLETAKGKILIDVDKGYVYFPQVIKLLKETGTLRQAIINIDDNTTFDEVEARYGKVPDDIILMPIVVYNDKVRAEAVATSYLRHKNTIFQPVWKDDKYIADENFVQLSKQGYGIWFNSLWASLCGGHDDDIAVEENKPAETWGWLIARGATIIQTDRPYLLLQYLKNKKLHR
jgi:glycerophosphoryl diester phosphodiesterase